MSNPEDRTPTINDAVRAMVAISRRGIPPEAVIEAVNRADEATVAGLAYLAMQGDGEVDPKTFQEVVHELRRSE